MVSITDPKQRRNDRQNEKRELQRLTRPTPPVKMRRCLNCGKSFKPNPKRKEHKFHDANCRKQFHRNGTAFPAVLKRIRDIVEQINAECNRPITDRLKAIEEGLATLATRLTVYEAAQALTQKTKALAQAHRPDTATH